MKKLFLGAIKIYQLYISPDTGKIGTHLFLGKTCRFMPTCSQYIYDAISRYGIIKGFQLGLRRILNCHPWGGSGWDPIPE